LVCLNTKAAYLKQASSRAGSQPFDGCANRSIFAAMIGSPDTGRCVRPGVLRPSAPTPVPAPATPRLSLESTAAVVSMK
jgi:hypothetical protein